MPKIHLECDIGAEMATIGGADRLIAAKGLGISSGYLQARTLLFWHMEQV